MKEYTIKFKGQEGKIQTNEGVITLSTSSDSTTSTLTDKSKSED